MLSRILRLGTIQAMTDMPLDHTQQRGPDTLAAHAVTLLALGGEGARVAVKDVIDIAGYPTMAGSRALEQAQPAKAHAAVVEALLATGCQITCKTMMHELAFGVTGFNTFAGTPPNPLFPNFVPGGSSSGSATVVAAGLVDFSLGTDTGGSIRVPAACCGIVGLKPTFGRLSRAGLTPETSSLDCVGPMARDVATIIEAMGILDPTFRAVEAPASPRLGLVTCEADAAIVQAVQAATEASGAQIVSITLPSLHAAFEASMVIMNAEMAAIFGHLLDSGKLGDDIAARLTRGKTITPEQVAAAEAVRRKFTAEVDGALLICDALVLPTLPAPPVRLSEAGDAVAALAMTRLARPFNLSGHPAIALPLPAIDGAPASLQLVSGKGDDAQLCALARWLKPVSSRSQDGDRS